MGPLMPYVHPHMGLTCPSTCWCQILRHHSLTPSRYWAQLPWGTRPYSRLWEIMVRLKSVGWLVYLILKRKKKSLLKNKGWKANPQGLDLFLTPWFYIHIFKCLVNMENCTFLATKFIEKIRSEQPMKTSRAPKGGFSPEKGLGPSNSGLTPL